MAQPVIKNSAEELVLDFAERAKESGFVVNVRRTPNLTDLSICLSRNCTLRLEIVKEDQTTVSAWIFVRTHSENFEGERSDLNDLLSVVELIALCTVGELSPSLLSYAYPAIDEPAGVYARVIMFERDGILGCVPSELTIAKFERILRSSLLGVECMARMLSREHVRTGGLQNNLPTD